MNEHQGIMLANYSRYSGKDGDMYLWNERWIEGLYLMGGGVVGMFLNVAVIVMSCVNPQLRKWMTSFTIHGSLMEIIKSAFCVPFALTLLNDEHPKYCAALGTAYVVAQTVGMFNLLTMVLTEAYSFHVHNLNQSDPDRGGAVMCVVFGIVMIYLGSVIVHLGPTLIGGHLSFNKDIGNCLFAYGEIQHFIVQAMWIGIITLTFVIIFRYICKFYWQLKANEQFRITVLARYMASMSRGETANESIFDVVYRLKKRVRVLFSIALINMLCWYPLFILTLVDYKYEAPRYYYRILTVLAWSHSFLTPIPLLTLDRSFGVWFQVKRAIKTYRSNNVASPDPSRSLLANQSKPSSPDPISYNERIKNTVASCEESGGKVSTCLVNVQEVGKSFGKLNVQSSPNPLDCTFIGFPNGGVYDRLNVELHQVGTHIPSPISPGDTVESRVNQSRETDFLYDFTSACS